MWRSCMFWWLFIVYAALTVGTLGVVGRVLLTRFETHALQEIEHRLHSEALLLRAALPHQPADSLQPWIEARGRDTGTHVRLLAADGMVLADSDREQTPNGGQTLAGRPEVRFARDGQLGGARPASNSAEPNSLAVALRTTSANDPVQYVHLAADVSSLRGLLGHLRRIVWSAMALSGVGAALLAVAIMRRLTERLRELTDTARRLAVGEFRHKAYAIGHDEIANLARTFNDMSERLARQFSELEEDGQQLRTILSGMVEGVVALDAEQHILFANERAAQLLEFQAQTAVGRKLWQVVRQRSLQELVQQALSGSTPHQGEVTWSGRIVKSLTVYAARLPGWPAHGAVLVLHDTSELRRLERLRHEFVANVSHELKTPLSVIKVCVETLLDGAAEDPGPRERFLEQIADQGERLHALILDLLSLARIESGEELFELEEVAVEPLVGACLERQQARAEAKNQLLEIAPPRGRFAVPADPVTVWADEEAMCEILDNLVDNAVKYTPEGGHIRLRWWAEASDAYLEVEDTGIGIPEQDLPRIFERFYRVDKARSRELGGTGLGLSIVKHLVQAMHGSISASSQLEKGTTFTVRLPRPPAD